MNVPRPAVVLLGVPVDDVTMDEAVGEIVRLAREGRERSTWHQVTTVNLDFVANAVADRDLMRILQRASLNLADGMPILWAAKALGTPLCARVAGVDLVERLAARSAAGDLSLYFFGAGPGIAEEAARRLVTRHPGAVVRHGTGTPRIEGVTTDSTALDEIRSARPDVLCVALGNPKQERWIERHAAELGVPVLIGVGGTFDLIVGRRRRAPLWMQRAGLEWIARALQEPARLLPRYAKDAAVCIPRFAAQWRRQRADLGGRRWEPAAVDRLPDGTVTIHARHALDLRRDPGLRALSLDGVSNLRLQLASVSRADARTVATLVSLARSVEGLHIDGLQPGVREDLARDGVLPIVSRESAARAAAAPSP